MGVVAEAEAALEGEVVAEARKASEAEELLRRQRVGGHESHGKKMEFE